MSRKLAGDTTTVVESLAQAGENAAELLESIGHRFAVVV
jgi:hypothetical protein